MEEVAGAGCYLAEECRTELRWLRRCFSGGPGSFPLSPPRRRRTTARSPGSSLARPPSAWGWGSCPERDPRSLHCPRKEAAAVEGEVRETVGADPLIYKVRFHHCQAPFLVRCPSLEVSSLSSGSPRMKRRSPPWIQSPFHRPFPPAPRHLLLHSSSGFSACSCLDSCCSQRCRGVQDLNRGRERSPLSRPTEQGPCQTESPSSARHPRRTAYQLVT